jgi:hypothetical protein
MKIRIRDKHSGSATLATINNYSFLIVILVSFSNNPTSSAELCNLYCQIQLFSGRQCSSNATVTSTTSTTLLSSTTTATSAAVGTETTTAASIVTPVTENFANTTSSAVLTTSAIWEPCPSYYLTDPAQALLCALWTELQSIESIYNSGPVFVTPVLESTSCIFR